MARPDEAFVTDSASDRFGRTVKLRRGSGQDLFKQGVHLAGQNCFKFGRSYHGAQPAKAFELGQSGLKRSDLCIQVQWRAAATIAMPICRRATDDRSFHAASFTVACAVSGLGRMKNCS